MNVKLLEKIEKVSRDYYNCIKDLCYGDIDCDTCPFFNKHCKIGILRSLSIEVSRIAYKEKYDKKYVVIDKTRCKVVNNNLSYHIIFGPDTSAECHKFKDKYKIPDYQIIEIKDVYY